MGALKRIVENDLIHRVSPDEYRDKIKDVYGGRKGAFLATASKVSLHIQFGRRLIRSRKFDVRGMKSILDVGSGAGQIAGHLLEFADRDAQITCTDLSAQMLRRARTAAEERSADVRRRRCRRPALCRWFVRRPHLRLRAGACAGAGERAWRNVPRAVHRRPDAVARDRGQLLRRLDKPPLVLPHVQPAAN